MNAFSKSLIKKVSNSKHYPAENPQFANLQTRSSLRFSNTHWCYRANIMSTEYSLQLLSNITSTSLNKDMFNKDIFSLFRRITFPYLSIITGDTRRDTHMTSSNHPLMIPLHRLWVKSNNRTRGQFECDVTWICFCFDFVCSYALCGCCSVVCLGFQVVQIK